MLNQPRNTESGVSPVVAVILLVAVTVTLSAVIGTFALNLGQSATSSSNQQDIGTKTTYDSDGNATVQVITGSADEVKVLVNGTQVGTITNPQPGDTVTVSATQADSLTVVATTDGDSTVVSSSTSSTSSTDSAAYTVAEPTDGIIAHWRFDDASDTSTAIDEESTYNGTIYGATYDSTRYQLGSHSIGLNGSSDYIDVGAKPLPPNMTKPWTATMWVYVDGEADKGGATSLLSQADDGGNNYNGWGIQFTDPSTDGGLSNDTIGILNRDGTSGWKYQARWNDSKYSGKWVMLTFVYDGSKDTSNQTIYLNETALPTERLKNQGVSDTPANVNARIGSREGTGLFFGGNIDGLRVYNRTLNQSEVSTLYNNTK